LIDLSSKTAVVTGAGQGVGLGIATAMAKKGAKVAMLGRTFSKVKNESTKLNEAGFITLALECDVKEPDSISNAQAEIKNNFGSVNVLINNAQEVPLGSILDVTDEAINAGWESGPLATFRLMKLFYEDLKGDGAIINLASSSALRPDSSGYGAYAAVKEAIRSLTRAAAVEWGKDNIRVNTIMPLANSVGMQWWVDERPEEANEFIETIPLKRIGDCENDIGESVCQLVSDGMNYITGSTIMLDGGQAYLR
jgi:meso-butanediol dehydrogenase/(S,S)-butanediol dehydrogenase/diacetyl reductase